MTNSKGMGDYIWGEERFALNTNRGPHYDLVKNDHVGHSRAMDLLMTGRTIDAAEA